MTKKNNKPVVGLALSGGSGRSIAHIGVLEVLQGAGISVDIITACSSGTLVAASYACGNLELLKQDWLKIDNNFIFGLVGLDRSGRGIFSVDKFGEILHKYFNKNFEDVKPRLGFVVVDVITGKQETLMLGDLVKAAQASCMTPGILEPVKWGNKVLVDGGLFSVVPIEEAKELGADIVIGVDIAATRQIISKPYLRIWKGYNFVKKSLPGRIVGYIYDIFSRLYDRTEKIIFYNQSDFVEEELTKNNPSWFSTLARAMQLVNERLKEDPINPQICDVLISPNVKHLGKISAGNTQEMLEEGRRAANEALPDIFKVIKEYGWKEKNGVKHK